MRQRLGWRFPKRGLLGSAAAVVGQAPPEGDCVVSNESDGVASGPKAGAVHGVIAVVVVWVPHTAGVRKGARAPSKKSSLKSSKGSWGLPETIVLSWPVTGSKLTLPASFTTTPDCGSSTAM
jgi:hypothetical protein